MSTHTPTRPPRPRRRRRPGGFTLVELLVVISIIVLLTAAALPAVLPALASRKVSEGARTVQAVLAGTRDAAIRAGEPRGIRLIPDPQFPGPNTLAASSMIAIEPAPDHSEGRVIVFPWRIGNTPAGPQVIVVAEVRARMQGTMVLEPYPPTAWYWNIRQGDKIRFEGSGQEYTIAGPIRTGGASNPDRYINADADPAGGGSQRYISLPRGAPRPSGYVDANPLAEPPWHIPRRLPLTGQAHYLFGEQLLIVNGIDDDGDGWVDEGFDGIDNDGDGIIDPGYNGINDVGSTAPRPDGPADFFNTGGNPLGGEYEPEIFPAHLLAGLQEPSRYVILRRPVVAERAQEVPLPPDVVIDLTSFNAPGYSPERSRLPVDPISGVVDIMISPTGAIMPASAGQQSAFGSEPYSSLPFLHFWITERADVVPWAEPTAPPYLLLPAPAGTPGYPAGATTLRSERRLVTVFTRTGQIVSNSIENFRADSADDALTPAQNQAINAARPYMQAQSGTRENP